MHKRAFTLVELIVVITILAILWTIAFISLSDYSKEARDSKRITDTSNLLSKINVENVRWINMSELINPLEKKTNILTINSKKEDWLQGYPNFNALKEPEENFLDPKSKHRYPFAYAIWWEWKESYNFMQMATVSEKDWRARLVWNYYKFNNDTDSPSLFVQDWKDWEDIDNDYIVDNWEVPPYDIWVPVAPLPPKTCPTGEQLIDWKCEAIICLEDEYLDWNDCIKHWTWDETDWFTYKDSSWNIVYPKNCNELLTNPIFKKWTITPYNWTRFVDWVFNIKPDWQEAFKVYCDMTNDDWGWTMIFWAKNPSNIIEYSSVGWYTDITISPSSYVMNSNVICNNTKQWSSIIWVKWISNTQFKVQNINWVWTWAWDSCNGFGWVAPTYDWIIFNWTNNISKTTLQIFNKDIENSNIIIWCGCSVPNSQKGSLTSWSIFVK